MGRDDEAARIAALLEHVPAGGGALVLRGEAGIGKSRLLEEAARLADAQGFAVLRATGVQTEIRVPFAGLHQLLLPLRDRIGHLPAPYRTALESAFGLTSERAPEPFRIALAVLDLLAEAALEAPQLVIVEDAHWIDESTADVLAFVARRLEADAVALVAAIREGYPSRLADAGLPELRLQPLASSDAERLLRAGRALPSAVRERVLDEAAGNPLALIELPRAAPTSGARAETDALALTERLERAFTDRVSDLPPSTRLVLLAAAMNESDQVAEALRVAEAVAGEALGLAALELAEGAGIVEVDAGALRFRHPLIRSAIRQTALTSEQRRMHEAFAEMLADDPDRAVWHRTALLDGEHEDLALELEQAAARARERGAGPVALTALERATALGAPRDRTRRLLATAQLAFELGRPDTVVTLLDEVAHLDASPVQRARATWILEMVDSKPLGDPAHSLELIAEAERAGAAGDLALQLDLLWLVAWRAWWSEPGAETRAALVAAARRLGDVETADPRVVAITAYAAPFADADVVLRRARTVSSRRRPDPEASRHFGAATVVLGTFDLAARLLTAAADALRAEGRVGHLPRMLVLQGHVASRRADWAVAMPAVDECRRLAVELDDPLWIAGADSVAATVAAIRGDERASEAAAEAAERISLPAGANVTTAMAQSARAMAALGAGRYADAFELSASLFDPASPAYHLVAGCWMVGDLAEAGLYAGEIDRARELVGRIETMVGAAPGLCAIGVRHARALLAEDDEAASAFGEALAQDLGTWPFQRARLLAAYGQWLRRQRRAAESRAPLREARDLFDALGCMAWGDRMRQELRAAGERSRRRTPDARDELTPHELQIAHLAADGLSNREIAQRLFVSHRTVSTHLSRIYPKLGVRRRGELASVLRGRTVELAS